MYIPPTTLKRKASSDDEEEFDEMQVDPKLRKLSEQSEEMSVDMQVDKYVKPIKLKIIRALDNSKMDVLISPTAIVESLKELIQIYVDLPDLDNVKIATEDEFLANASNEDCLADRGIKHDSIIYVTSNLPAELKPNPNRVKALTLDGKNFPVLINPSTTIERFKKLLQFYTEQADDEIPVSDQKLMTAKQSEVYRSTELTDGSVFMLCRRSLTEQTPVKLNISVPGGEKIRILIRLCETVEFLKQQISIYTGVPDVDQELFIEGLPIRTGDLSTLKISGGSEISMRDITDEPDYNVTVMVPSGDDLTMQVKKVYLIGDIKKMVEKEEDIFVGSQRMFTGGMETRDNRTLESYNVRAKSRLHVLFRDD